MKKVELWLLAYRIEHRWRQIGKNRERMGDMLEKGSPYTSPALVRMDGQNAQLGCEAARMEKRYIQLSGLPLKKVM